MKTFSFFILALVATVLGCTQSIDCISGECIQDFCACASGIVGSDCNSSSPSLCTQSWHNLSNLLTDNYPVLDTTYSSVSAGSLRLRLTSPLVYNRQSTYVYLADPVAFPECALGNWSKSIVDCHEQYDFELPWSQAVACGWTEDNSQPGYKIWFNDLFVQHHDLLSVFRGSPVYRDTQHTFHVQLKFRTTVEVSTTLNILAPVNLLAAITRQQFDPESGLGTIEFTTSLQWPFELVNPRMNDQPLNLSISLGATQLNCGATSGNVCNQKYTLHIEPGPEICTLSGPYTLLFDLVCRGSPQDCPLDAAVTANVTGLVFSENFCAGLDIDIGLTGSMETFADPLMTIPKTSFLSSQQVYFKISLSTDGTGEITDSRITDIKVENGNQTTFVRQDGVPTPAGLAVGAGDVVPAQPEWRTTRLFNQGTWNVPDCGTPCILTVLMTGGGGTGVDGGGGGAGDSLVNCSYSVPPSSSLFYSVGAGGSGGSCDPSGDGTASTLGDLVANGGEAGSCDGPGGRGGGVNTGAAYWDLSNPSCPLLRGAAGGGVNADGLNGHPSPNFWNSSANFYSGGESIDATSGGGGASVAGPGGASGSCTSPGQPGYYAGAGGGGSNCGQGVGRGGDGFISITYLSVPPVVDTRDIRTQPAFLITPNNDIFPVALDSSASFTVSATIEVSYTGALGKKRVMRRQVQSGSQLATTTARILLGGGTTQVTQEESSQNTLVVENSAVTLGMCCLLFLLN